MKPASIFASRGAEADVVLVAMPFGPNVLQPSLGLGLLQAALEPLGVHRKTLYLTLKLAERIGVPLYSKISSTEPTVMGFAGDWIFTSALFDSHDHDVDGYVDNVLRAPSDPALGTRDKDSPFDEELIQHILDIRTTAVGFVEGCLMDVLSWSPRIVGFTSTFQQHVGALALARRLREERPDLFIVFGGANCEGIMGAELLRQFDFVDAVVSGEGDEVFPRLVEAVLEGRDWRGLQGVNSSLGGGLRLAGGNYSTTPMIHDMDALPYPDFEDFFDQLERADLGDRSALAPPRLMFETSRGCWWGAKSHCTFCGLNGSNMAFRAKSEQRALDELLYFHDRYPECPVSVTDNILDMKYFGNFLPELSARQIDLKLFYEVKANLRKDQVKLMRDAGILDIQPGVESFIDSVLALMKKGVKGLQNIQLLKWCKEFGVFPHWNMLWGFPGESPDAYLELAETLPSLFHLPPPGGCGMIRLDRFSPNFDRADELGFVDVTPYPAYEYLYPFGQAALSNMAYFFTYGYRERRDVRSYTTPVRERLEEWRAQYEDSDLFYVDKGDRLLVMDLRSTADRPITVLTGIERHLYVECDSIRGLGQLRAGHPDLGESCSDEELAEVLEPLVAQGLLVKSGPSYLSLALPLGEYSPSARIIGRLHATMKALGSSSEGQVKVPLAAMSDDRKGGAAEVQ